MHDLIEQRHSLRVLIISSRHASEAENKREARVFGGMVKTLIGAGLNADHRAIRSERDFQASVGLTEPDIVLNALCFSSHASGSYRGIQKILTEKGYAQIGTDEDSLALIDSRCSVQERWRRDGINTPQSFSVCESQDGPFEGIEKVGLIRDFPWSIRPDIGIVSRRDRYASVASSNMELRKTINNLSRKFKKIVVEKCPGSKSDVRFYSVGAIGNYDRTLMMPLELHIKKRTHAYFITDWDIARRRIVPTPVYDKALEDELKHFARTAYISAGVRDFARMDVIRSESAFYAIDIKSQPFVPDPLFDACAANAGLDQDQRTIAIFIAGFARLFREGSAFISIPSKMSSYLAKPFFSILYG
jgi:D-alanine-D-alanine ligase-like ATP-grasp enzyme